VALFALAGCGKGKPAPKPTIQQAWAAAKLPPLARGPGIPARRTNVLPVPPWSGSADDPALVALGKSLFFDARLSEPQGTSCASCHDPAHGFSGVNGSTLGVPRGSRPGHFAQRTAPSVMYLRYVPAFHWFEDDEAPAPEPKGGFFWDGRVDSLAELVAQPLFNPDEMNAGSARRIAEKIARGPYAKEFRGVAGATSPQAVMRGVGAAIEAYLKSDELSPARSKYDAYVRGQATLTEAERRGLEAFKDRRRGACAGCHRMTEMSSNPAESMFTDYGYDAIALPRNRALPGGADPSRFDLGLCARKEARGQASSRSSGQDPKRVDEKLCAAFRTPSLRNVALRESFGHNGVYRTLREAVAFYARRAVALERIYPAGKTWDDVPERYRGNVNIHAPVYNRSVGGTPPLSEEEIDDVVAFLGTLTDAPRVAEAAADTASIAPGRRPPR